MGKLRLEAGATCLAVSGKGAYPWAFYLFTFHQYIHLLIYEPVSIMIIFSLHW